MLPKMAGSKGFGGLMLSSDLQKDYSVLQGFQCAVKDSLAGGQQVLVKEVRILLCPLGRACE